MGRKMQSMIGDRGQKLQTDSRFPNDAEYVPRYLRIILPNDAAELAPPRDMARAASRGEQGLPPCSVSRLEGKTAMTQCEPASPVRQVFFLSVPWLRDLDRLLRDCR